MMRPPSDSLQVEAAPLACRRTGWRLRYGAGTLTAVFDAFRSLFARRENADVAQDPSRSLQIAACALLLELAHADQEFAPDEQRQIEDVAMRHFDLPAESVRELMAVADEARREAVDLHQFTHLVAQHYDEGQRIVLAELMWRVIHADGRLTEQESRLARKIANLLDLKPGYLAEARRRVERPGS